MSEEESKRKHEKRVGSLFVSQFDKSLLKQLPYVCFQEDKNKREVIETALREYIEKRKGNWKGM